MKMKLRTILVIANICIFFTACTQKSAGTNVINNTEPVNEDLVVSTEFATEEIEHGAEESTLAATESTTEEIATEVEGDITVGTLIAGKGQEEDTEGDNSGETSIETENHEKNSDSSEDESNEPSVDNVITGNDAPYGSNPDDTEHLDGAITFGDD